MALALLGLCGLMVALLTIFVLVGPLSFDGREKVATILLSPVTGLLGAVLGVYYGEHSRGR